MNTRLRTHKRVNEIFLLLLLLPRQEKGEKRGMRKRELERESRREDPVQSEQLVILLTDPAFLLSRFSFPLLPLLLLPPLILLGRKQSVRAHAPARGVEIGSRQS